MIICKAISLNNINTWGKHVILINIISCYMKCLLINPIKDGIGNHFSSYPWNSQCHEINIIVKTGNVHLKVEIKSVSNLVMKMSFNGYEPNYIHNILCNVGSHLYIVFCILTVAPDRNIPNCCWRCPICHNSLCIQVYCVGPSDYKHNWKYPWSVGWCSTSDYF